MVFCCSFHAELSKVSRTPMRNFARPACLAKVSTFAVSFFERLQWCRRRLGMRAIPSYGVSLTPRPKPRPASTNLLPVRPMFIVVCIGVSSLVKRMLENMRKHPDRLSEFLIFFPSISLLPPFSQNFRSSRYNA